MTASRKMASVNLSNQAEVLDGIQLGGRAKSAAIGSDSAQAVARTEHPAYGLPPNSSDSSDNHAVAVLDFELSGLR